MRVLKALSAILVVVLLALPSYAGPSEKAHEECGIVNQAEGMQCEVIENTKVKVTTNTGTEICKQCNDYGCTDEVPCP